MKKKVGMFGKCTAVILWIAIAALIWQGSAQIVHFFKDESWWVPCVGIFFAAFISLLISVKAHLFTEYVFRQRQALAIPAGALLSIAILWASVYALMSLDVFVRVVVLALLFCILAG